MKKIIPILICSVFFAGCGENLKTSFINSSTKNHKNDLVFEEGLLDGFFNDDINEVIEVEEVKKTKVVAEQLKTLKDKEDPAIENNLELVNKDVELDKNKTAKLKKTEITSEIAENTLEKTDNKKVLEKDYEIIFF